MKIYKIYEQFSDCWCYATEKGVIDVANNDRTKDDGTEVDEIVDIETAKKFLEEEKFLEVITTEFESLDDARAFEESEMHDIEEKTEDYIVVNL